MQIDTSTLTAQPFFKGLSERHLLMLARHTLSEKFSADQFIFREGQPANRFYLLQEGEVALESSAMEKEGRHRLIQIIRDGEALGWSWLFPPHYWHFGARAITPVKTIFIDGARLRELCESDYDFGHELMVRISLVVVGRLLAGKRHGREPKSGPEPEPGHDQGRNRGSMVLA